jgi:signal transduction histidine kinase
MRRLYLQIYLALVASLAVFAVGAALLWRGLLHNAPTAQTAEIAAEVAAGALPAPGATPEEQQRALERLSANGRVWATLTAPDGRVLARVGPADGSAQRWTGWSLVLPDGRILSARLPRHTRPSIGPLGFLLTLALLATAVALAAYPVVRRLTRRLERLKASVDALGAGDLRTRVAVRGHDEVAALAASFNRSAERIETLMAANRALLANASHELRSPLARIRMGLELLGANAPAGIREELARDIAELDALVEEILLSSRLDAGGVPERREPVDLLALAAEEGARVGAEASGASAIVSGDPTLLRRMLRNLAENAQRHGAAPIEIEVVAEADRALVRVLDRGPGVPDPERERIFEPFYRLAGERSAGAGLGLSLVRQIAAKHGGTARCDARAGGGVVFTVDLPLVPASSMRAS